MRYTIVQHDSLPAHIIYEIYYSHRVLNIPGGSSIFYGKISQGRKSKFVLSFDRNELLTYFFLKKLDNLIGHCAKLTNVQNFTSEGG